MPVRITTSRRGKPLNQIAKEEAVNEKLTQAKWVEIGKRSHEAMRAIIDRNRRTPKTNKTPNLVDSINFVANVGVSLSFWGIGDKAILNKQVPYWGAINWGSKHTIPDITPKNVDYLKFKGASDGKTLFLKKVNSRPQVIPPMNYIEKTTRFLLRELIQFKRVTRR